MLQSTVVTPALQEAIDNRRQYFKTVNVQHELNALDEFERRLKTPPPPVPESLLGAQINIIHIERVEIRL